ncbi:MAG: hypothetical protein R2856_19925 [Caldilineaceae bacterium]
MPLPMVHFAVAVDLYAALNQAISPEFLLGSIAPDAIHLRDGWTQADKVITHFGLPYDYPDWAKIEPILRGQWTRSPFAALTAGYVAHVLTDQLWIDTVAIPNRDRIPAELSQDERRALLPRNGSDRLQHVPPGAVASAGVGSAGRSANRRHRSPAHRPRDRPLAAAHAALVHRSGQGTQDHAGLLHRRAGGRLRRARRRLRAGRTEEEISTRTPFFVIVAFLAVIAVFPVKS